MSATAAATIPGFCGLCIARCGSIATVEDGRFTRLDPDPGASDRPGALRQGPSSAGAGLQQGAAHPALAPHPAKRRGGSGLGGDLMGRSARCDRSGDETAGGDARATERGVQPVVSFHHRNRRVCALSASVDEGLRHAEPRVGAGHVRLGPRLRDALRVRRRERRHRQRRRGDGGHREQRLPDPLGLQSLLYAPHARDRDRRCAQARNEAYRHRPAPCRTGEQGRSLATRSPRRRRRVGARSCAYDDQPRLV